MSHDHLGSPDPGAEASSPNSHFPPPPNYFASAASSSLLPAPSEIYLDVVPRSNAASFQEGFLGVDGCEAYVKGEVLIKLPASTENPSVGQWHKVTIELKAVESVNADPPLYPSPETVELFSTEQTLWSSAAPSTSSVAQSLPSMLPFSIPLTADLPHCIHLASSRLEYVLEARIHSAQPEIDGNVVKRTPVHLSRYSKPGPLVPPPAPPLPSTSALTAPASEASRSPSFCPSLEPRTWTLSSPFPIHIQLSRTLYRRAESLEIRVRIPPPDPTLVTDKGVSLRNVTADLVRLIEVRRSHGTPMIPEAKSLNEKAIVAGKMAAYDAAPSHEMAPWLHSRVPEAGEPSTSHLPPSPPASTTPTHPPPPSLDSLHRSSSPPPFSAAISTDHVTHPEQPPPPPDEYEHQTRALHAYHPITPPPEERISKTVLAHSGKSCRFHSSRSVLLRLSLHPPFPANSLSMDAASTDENGQGEHNESGASGTTATGSKSKAALIQEEAKTTTHPLDPSTSLEGGCSSVTQSTILHDVRFEVRIRVVARGGAGERLDQEVSTEVCILPAAAPSWAVSNADDRTAGEEENAEGREERQAREADAMFGWGSDEEYDGYDDAIFGAVDTSSLSSSPGSTDIGPSSRFAASADNEVVRASALACDPPPSMTESVHDFRVHVDVLPNDRPPPPPHEDGGDLHRQQQQQGYSRIHPVTRYEDVHDPPPPLLDDEEEELPPQLQPFEFGRDVLGRRVEFAHAQEAQRPPAVPVSHASLPLPAVHVHEQEDDFPPPPPPPPISAMRGTVWGDPSVAGSETPPSPPEEHDFLPPPPDDVAHGPSSSMLLPQFSDLASTTAGAGALPPRRHSHSLASEPRRSHSVIYPIGPSARLLGGEHARPSFSDEGSFGVVPPTRISSVPDFVNSFPQPLPQHDDNQSRDHVHDLHHHHSYHSLDDDSSSPPPYRMVGEGIGAGVPSPNGGVGGRPPAYGGAGGGPPGYTYIADADANGEAQIDGARRHGHEYGYGYGRQLSRDV